MVVKLFLFLSLSARGNGLCDAYTSVAVGFDAIEYNPANLVFSPTFSFNLATIGINYTGNIPLYQFIGLIQRTNLSEKDKKLLCNGINSNLYGKMQSLSLSYKNFAISSYFYTQQKFIIPKDVTQLLFYGNEPDKKYDLSGIFASNKIIGVATISYAKKLKEKFGVGLTFKYFHPLTYFGIVNSTGYIFTGFSTVDTPKVYGDGSITYRYGSKGYGYGLDFGIIYFSDKINIGASIINLINNTIWNSDAFEVKSSFKIDSVDLEHFDEKNISWNNITNKINKFNTKEPTKIRLGASLKHKFLLVASDVGYDGDYAFFSIGTEISSPIIGIRSGISISNHLFYSIGLTLHPLPLTIDIGIKMSAKNNFVFSTNVYIFKK